MNIRADSHAEFRQWFYFRLQGARGQACSIRFVNAGQCTYVDGWLDYRAMASYDRRRWFRVPTSFDGQVMTVSHTPELDSIYYAYFEPYSWERHLRLLRTADTVRVEPDTGVALGKIFDATHRCRFEGRDLG